MEERKKHPGGRPLKFKSVEELEKKIDAYFKKCSENTKRIVNKAGEVEEVDDPIPFTISGLAVALDCDRNTLLNYEKNEEYFCTIKRAKEKCLADAEERLYTKFTPGVIFSMKNNYGFVDKQEIEQKTEVTFKVEAPEGLSPEDE